MKEIGLELNNATGALPLSGAIIVLACTFRICVLAPGGYRPAVLDLNPTASIDAPTKTAAVPYPLPNDAILVRKSFSRTPRCLLLNTASI
jgi:hypothetical protein